MYVSDTPNGLDTDLFSWDGTTPGNSETVLTNTNTIISPQPTRHGTFNNRNMTVPAPVPAAGTTTTTNHKQPRTLAPNLTRRSHKKSRAGCFTCKHRKIKCGEQKPKCANCVLKSLDCLYPTIPTDSSSTTTSSSKRNHTTKDAACTTTASPTSASNALTKPSFLSSSYHSPTFTLLDMRFFHHFLTTAYPHLPLGNDHVWVNEIPQFAESQPYLMHALLSLGASHLGRLTGVDYRRESLTHRGKAIAGLNRALSSGAGGADGDVDLGGRGGEVMGVSGGAGDVMVRRVTRNWGESDAMLAACYALTFQASYMGDGLADFITMVRGCALTTGKIKDEGCLTAFNLQPDWHFKIMAPRLANLPCVDARLVEAGLRGLEGVRGPVVLGGSMEMEREDDGSVVAEFHQALVEVLEALRESPREGYLGFAGLYSVW
jgi:hypothetical protein